MRLSPLLWTVVLGLLALAAAWVFVGLGSQMGEYVFMPGWIQALMNPGDAMEYSLIVNLRAPRVAAGLVVGVCLAVAGQLLQGVTRNPLADPYLLGISGGAGLMVVLLHAFYFVVETLGWWLVPTMAFVGAAGAAFAVLRLARGPGGRMTVLGLILSGVVINAFCAALMGFMLVRFDPFHQLITRRWLAGGLSFVYWPQIALVTTVALAALVYLRARAHDLNALSLGTSGAETVGVDADRLLMRAALISSLLTGLGVSLAGLLGYVGLIVPHAVRLLLGNDFRATLPVTAVAGALLLVVADAAARLAFAPEELPVGVLTAIVGCPLLLILLRAQMRGSHK